MKNKKIFLALILLLIFIGGTFTAVQVKGYLERSTFTKEKWANEPDKRYIIVKDMMRKYDFSNMTRQQVIDLLGEPDNVNSVTGVAVRTSGKGSKFITFRNENDGCYLTRTGDMPEEYSGLYIQFDDTGKVIDFCTINFTT